MAKVFAPPFLRRSAVMVVGSTFLGVLIGATLSSLLSSCHNPRLQQQQQQQKAEEWSSTFVKNGEGGASPSMSWAARRNAAASSQMQDMAPKSLIESADGSSSSYSTGSSSSPLDPTQCGADALKPLVWGSNGEWSYTSCDLCGLSAAQVADMLAQPHDCEGQIWYGWKWHVVESLCVLNRSEEPLCIVACSSMIPCRGHSSSTDLSTQLAGAQVRLHAPFGGPACLLALWLRPGTSDALVLGQVFVLGYGNEMKQLGILPPDSLPISTVLDAGANIGLAAVYFAMLYPGARIVSVEPSSANFNVLLRNVARFPNVLPLERALWPSATRLYLTQPFFSPLLPEFAYEVFENRTQVPNTSFIVSELQSVSVDFLLKSLALQRFDLLKIDIEGAETEVFREGANVDFLSSSSVAIVETHDLKWPGAREIVLAALKRFPRWNTTLEGREHLFFVAS